jgi:hypothetical protein
VVISLIYQIKNGRVSNGEAIGILLLDTYAPHIPGDVANATTYSFPVRYKTIKDFTVSRIFGHDMSILPTLIEAGKELVQAGVKAITGDCGYMALYQKELASHLDVPVFMSSLLQVPFMSSMLGSDEKVGIICANSQSMNRTVLNAVGIHEAIPITIRGLENQKNFYEAGIEEIGILDYPAIEQEVVSVARQMVQDDPKIKAVLLECSMFPPYSKAVSEAVNLPVFDFVTMINHVYSTLVKKRFLDL